MATAPTSIKMPCSASVSTTDSNPPSNVYNVTITMTASKQPAYLARVELARGDLDRALVLCDEQIERAKPHFAPKLDARGLELRGHVLLAMDRREEAAEAAHRGPRSPGRSVTPRASGGRWRSWQRWHTGMATPPERRRF